MLNAEDVRITTTHGKIECIFDCLRESAQNMTYNIRKVGVIGSGTMGGGIALLLAGVGLPVTLLDIAAKDTNTGDPAVKRNAIVLDNLNKLKKSRIPAIFHPDDVDRVTVGNLD